MKTGILLAVCLQWTGVARAAEAIQPLDVKVGLWEVTHTTAMAGQPPLPAEVLDKMPPEKRARFEEMMKSRAAQGPRTTTSKQCVTKEELNKNEILGEDSKSCTRTVVTSTRRKLDARLTCTEQGTKRTGTFGVEAVDPEHVKGAVQMAVSGGDHTMTVNSTFTGKWIGPVCEKGD